MIIGTVFVGGFTGWKLISDMEKNRKYLDEKYGRKIMDGVGYLGGALQLGAVVAVSRGWVSNTSSLSWNQFRWLIRSFGNGLLS